MFPWVGCRSTSYRAEQQGFETVALMTSQDVQMRTSMADSCLIQSALSEFEGGGKLSFFSSALIDCLDHRRSAEP